MKKLLILFSIALLFSSCTKEKDCEVNDSFYMELNNGSNNPYDVYVNDVFLETLDGKKQETYQIPAGYFKIKVIQVSGYLLYPTEKEYTGSVAACESYYITFP